VWSRNASPFYKFVRTLNPRNGVRPYWVTRGYLKSLDKQLLHIRSEVLYVSFSAPLPSSWFVDLWQIRLYFEETMKYDTCRCQQGKDA